MDMKQGLILSVFGLLLAGVSLGAHAANTAAGQLLRVAGDVSLISKDRSPTQVRVGHKFKEGDVVVTGAEGWARILLSEAKNELVLGPDTQLLIEKVGSSTRSRVGTRLFLQAGHLQSVVKHTYSGSGDETFEVRTPNAAARGSETVFVLTFDPRERRSVVAVEDGSLMWRSQLREILVSGGRFSVAQGRDVSWPIDQSHDAHVASLVQRMKHEAGQHLSFERSESSPEPERAGALGIHPRGHEIIVEKQERSQGSPQRGPAAIESDPLEHFQSRAGPSRGRRVGLSPEEKKLASSKVPTPRSSESAPTPLRQSTLESQRSLRDQRDFVQRNSSILKPD
jgi:hypothetical protein